MKSNVGLWIDHRKAVIVSLTEKAEKIRRIVSHMEKHVRFSGEAQETSAEDQCDRRFAGNLHKYYEKVVSCIRDADSILILGPGEAKVELKTCLESEALGSRITGIETVDKMTDRQIAAKVRKHFLNSAKHSQKNLI
jgi:stalled ribosome rescue protein Dom34